MENLFKQVENARVNVFLKFSETTLA